MIFNFLFEEFVLHLRFRRLIAHKNDTTFFISLLKRDYVMPSTVTD